MIQKGKASTNKKKTMRFHIKILYEQRISEDIARWHVRFERYGEWKGFSSSGKADECDTRKVRAKEHGIYSARAIYLEYKSPCLHILHVICCVWWWKMRSQPCTMYLFRCDARSNSLLLHAVHTENTKPSHATLLL